MKDYEDIEDLIKDNSSDCYMMDDEICGGCGCDMWQVYYLFGRVKCDACLKKHDYITC